MMEQNKRKIKHKQNLILFCFLYIGFIYLALHIGAVFNDSVKGQGFEVIFNIDSLVYEHIKAASFFMPNLNDIYICIFLSIIYCAVVTLYLMSVQKKFMFGKEQGSAEWAGEKERKKICDKDPENNIILTGSEKLGLNTRATRKNLNVLIIGSSGAGKTRFFVKPNIMQTNTSYIITDPKGELVRDTGYLMQKEGYKVKVFNLKDMSNSSRYNPFAYIREENDVMRLINCLIRNTNPKTASLGDPFWEKSEMALLQAIFFFMWYELVPAEQNFKTVMEMLRYADVKEDDEEYESDLDIIFKQLAEEKPDHIALKQYNIFKQAAGKTTKSILISVGVRLSLFNMKAVANLTDKDELDLHKIGDEKTVVYVVIPDADTTFNFIVAMMYSQLFDTLYNVADSDKKGRLKYHTRFILDEFANIGQIPDFERYIATMRSREISVSIIIQSMAQLKAMYEKTWESIVGNCDSLLFLGGREQSTREYISKDLGKETIDTRNINFNKGRNANSSYNYGIQGRELLQLDELAILPDSDCVLLIRGVRPFYSKKYDIEKHKNYKYLFDSSDDYFFDFSKVKKYETEKSQEEERERVLKNYTIKDFELDQDQIARLIKNFNMNEDVGAVEELDADDFLFEEYFDYEGDNDYEKNN